MTGQSADYDEKTWSEALAWLFRVNENPNDPETEADLRKWLGKKDSHVRAFEEARRIWVLTGHAQPAYANRWQGPVGKGNEPATLPPVHRRDVRKQRGGTEASLRRPRRRVFVGIALAACFCLVIVSSVWRPFAADYATGIGEIGQFDLQDGSRVRLGSQSGLDVVYDPLGRTVELVRGAALFEVAPDTDRPFVVRAGPVRVRVTGTAFDVQMHPAALSVAVRQGRVQIDPLGSGSENHELAQGEYMRVDMASGAIHRGAISPKHVAAWLQGRLIVDRWTVRDVVDAIDRHLSGAILVMDEDLAAKPISGVYDLNKPVDAVRAVVQPYGGTVVEITPYLLIVSAR